jgi:hypothetical protein
VYRPLVQSVVDCAREGCNPFADFQRFVVYRFLVDSHQKWGRERGRSRLPTAVWTVIGLFSSISVVVPDLVSVVLLWLGSGYRLQFAVLDVSGERNHVTRVHYAEYLLSHDVLFVFAGE